MERFGRVILDTNCAFGKWSMPEQVPHFHTQRRSLLSSQFRSLCSENPRTEGRQGEDQNGPGFSQPSQMESPQLTFNVYSAVSWKMPEASLRCSPLPALLQFGVFGGGRHVTPSFPCIAMAKYLRQPMYQEEGFIWEHSFRGLNLQSIGLLTGARGSQS